MIAIQLSGDFESPDSLASNANMMQFYCNDKYEDLIIDTTVDFA